MWKTKATTLSGQITCSRTATRFGIVGSKLLKARARRISLTIPAASDYEDGYGASILPPRHCVASDRKSDPGRAVDHDHRVSKRYHSYGDRLDQLAQILSVLGDSFRLMAIRVNVSVAAQPDHGWMVCNAGFMTTFEVA